MRKQPMMHTPSAILWTGLLAAAVFALGTGTGHAQTQEVKEKPRLYTYEAMWTIPRAKWADFDKANAVDQKVLDAAVTSGALLGYGNDASVVHQADGSTHDNWWSASSLAAALEVLESLSKNAGAPVLTSATSHSDNIFVSRFYNWKAGTYKGAYTHAAVYKLKADAPDDAVESLSKSFIVPLMEKLLAAGAIVEYEVDEEAIHTESPDLFWVDYICPTAAGLDKANAALGEAMKANPMIGPALSSMVDITPHRDYLLHTNAVYK